MGKEVQRFIHTKDAAKTETYRISNSLDGTAGKAMFLMGAGALLVPVLAAILPGGVLVAAAILMLLGAFLAE